MKEKVNDQRRERKKYNDGADIHAVGKSKERLIHVIQRVSSPLQ